MPGLRNVVELYVRPVENPDQVIKVDPIELLQPYGMGTKNAIIDWKTVHQLGPQPGDPGKGETDFHNNGLSLTPQTRAWLELSGQHSVGLTVRHDRGAVPEPWDAPYVVAPQDGSVI